MTHRTFEAYQRWASTYDSDPNPQTALEVRHVLQALAVTPNARVLDAACGTGRYFPHLLPNVAKLVGCDFAPAMLRQARQRFLSAQLVLADLLKLPFRAADFTHILCTQTLKHSPDLRTPLLEFFRVLRPGGSLVFSVTHPDMDFTGYEMRTTPSFILSEEADIFHHSRDDYLGAIVSAGFEGPAMTDVRVTEEIADLLTPESFALVRGRPQVAIFRALRPLAAA